MAFSVAVVGNGFQALEQGTSHLPGNTVWHNPPYGLLWVGHSQLSTTLENYLAFEWASPKSKLSKSHKSCGSQIHSFLTVYWVSYSSASAHVASRIPLSLGLKPRRLKTCEVGTHQFPNSWLLWRIDFILKTQCFNISKMKDWKISILKISIDSLHDFK